MNELRSSEAIPKEIENALIQVLHSLGFRAEEVSREGWSYNPKTGYLRFKAFAINEAGEREYDTVKMKSVEVEKARKLKPFWRKRLESAFELYKDEHVPKVPR